MNTLTDVDVLDVILGLLRDAAQAHGIYEAEQLGGVYDDEWPEWYARRMTDQLAHAGYVLGRADL